MQPDHLRILLESELDTEIWLKQQEKAQIEQEIARGEEMISALKRESFTSSSSRQANSESSVSCNSLHLSSSTPSTTIIEMTIDGRQVQLACPECKRTSFFSLTGFVNHCRIVHNLVFLSPEERIERCGIPIQQQPTLHSEIASTTNNKEVFEREFVLGTTNAPASTSYSHHNSMIQQKLARIRAECLMNQPEKRPQIKCFSSQEINLSCEVEKNVFLGKVFPVQELELFPTQNHATMEISPQLKCDSFSSHFQEMPSTTSSSCLQNNTFQASPLPPQFGQFCTTHESRFYIIKRIIIGNLVKAWEDDSGMPIYKWKLYIRDEEDFLQKNLQKATIYLHSSYRPDDVVQLEQYPFVLTRTGWGEFTVKIELDFSSVKHSIPLYYQLRLTQGKNSSRWVLGNERQYNIELEKLPSANNPLSEVSIDDCQLAPLVERPISTALQSGKEASSTSFVSTSNNTLQQQQQVARERKFCFCKFCGAQHLPLKCFSTLQQNCEYRLKLEHINSFTIFNEKRALECALKEESSEAVCCFKESNSTSSHYQLIPWLAQIPKQRSKFRMNEFVQSNLQNYTLNYYVRHQKSGGKEEDKSSNLGHLPDENIAGQKHYASLSMKSQTVIAEATQSFLRELIGRSLLEARECQAKAKKNYPTDDLRSVMLTPVHLYNVLVGVEKFDFLTNKNMLSC